MTRRVILPGDAGIVDLVEVDDEPGDRPLCDFCGDMFVDPAGQPCPRCGGGWLTTTLGEG